MSDIKLTCEETPLAWPASVGVDDLKQCRTCGIKVHAPQPGSLQILSRRKGAGDGVNIDESISVGADYRGQRYSFVEAIFHTPGLHRFPGQSEPYPAEYHIHLQTFTEPKRLLTLVIPVSHLVKGGGQDYFAAMAAKVNPNGTRPTLSSLIVPGTKMIQYQGPDIRGRTGDNQAPAEQCTATTECQFLLMLNVAHIRATDLERIPREGSRSTDPRDLPAPGVAPTINVPRDRLLRLAVLADPGVLSEVVTSTGKKVGDAPKTTELECKPVKIEGGRNVVDLGGKPVDVNTLLGVKSDSSNDKVKAVGDGVGADSAVPSHLGHRTAMFVGTLLGLLFFDWLFSGVWSYFFVKSPQLAVNEPIKIWIFLFISLSTAGMSRSITDSIQGFVSGPVSS
jgi:hypothetical protein